VRAFYYILVSLLISVASTAVAIDQTWQRVQVLGHSKAGDKILIFRSHFGPSSRAPFGQLQILNANSSVLTLDDGMGALTGDESTISFFQKQLLEKNRQKIIDAGIIFSDVAAVNALSYETNNEIVVETDLLRGGEISRFHVDFRSQLVSSCPAGAGRPLKAAYLEKTPITYFTPQIDSLYVCGVERYKFSRLLLIDDTAWFFVFAPVEVMPDLYFYSQVVFGMGLQ